MNSTDGSAIWWRVIRHNKSVKSVGPGTQQKCRLALIDCFPPSAEELPGVRHRHVYGFGGPDKPLHGGSSEAAAAFSFISLLREPSVVCGSLNKLFIYQAPVWHHPFLCP